MSLTDVNRLKSLIKLDSIQDEWISESKIVVSPFGDFMAVASSTAVAFFIKKYVNSRPEFQFVRLHNPSTFESFGLERSCGSITAVSYLPVKMEKQGGSQDLWHCVIVGYSSGVVEFVSDSGQILASKQLLEKPVLKFRTLTTNPVNNQGCDSFPAASCLVPRLNELLVVFESTLVSIAAQALLTTLVKNRKELAGLNASFDNTSAMTHSLSKFSCKKWTVKHQTVSDVAGISTPNFQLFDQLNLMSLNKDLLNEDHMRSLGTLIKYVTVGQSPFIQTNTPHKFGPQKVHELAENVVSTVKSGILRMATGFIWGSSPSAQAGGGSSEDVSADVEQKLDILHAFKDRSKSAITIEQSPSGRYAAILDSHHRILIQDNSIGAVIHILKGYHHAQMGWITTSWEGRKEVPDKHPNADQELAVLLVLYLPRRGILEIWSPEQMSRIVEFPVGKTGRLIQSSDAVLDSSARSVPCVRAFECAFLNPSGLIQKIYVPIHSLTSKSTSHDRTLHKQLKAILFQDSPIDEEKVSKLSEIILASKEATGKIRMLMDVFHCENVSADDCRTILTAVASQLAECSVATRHCSRLFRALNLYDFLMSKEDTEVDDEKVEHRNKWNEEDELNLIKTITNIDPNVENKESVTRFQDFSVAEFASCFHLRQLAEKDSSDQIGDDTSIDSLKISESKFSNCQSLLKLCFRLGEKALQDFDSTKRALNSAELEGGLLESVMTSFLSANVEDLTHFGPDIQELLYRLTFEVYTGGGGSPALIHKGRKILLKSNLSASTFVVVLIWKRFLAIRQSNTYAAEWDPVLKHIEYYLKIVEAKNNILPKKSDSVENSEHRYDDVFLAGNGRIAEIVASWVIESGIGMSDPEFESFLTECRFHFPLSCRCEIVGAHMSWQNFQTWSKNHSDLKHLEAAFECLQQLKSLPTKKRLTALAWNTFLNKSVRDAISLTEIRSATRCQRDLGMPEESLPKFLRISTKIVRIMFVDCDVVEVVEKSSDEKCYDVLSCSINGVEHLMDRVAKLSPPDDDAVAVQFQFVFVSNVIWNFCLDELKPLSMFNTQEANMFFQNATSLSISSTFRLFVGEHGRGVRNVRRRFVELSCDGAVACIHHTAGDELDLTVYQEWCNELLFLAKMWRIADKLRESQIVSLYRAGHDTIGEEILNSLDEEQRRLAGIKLLRVCLLRLAALNFDEERERRVGAIHVGLIAKLTALRSEATGTNGVVDVPLKSTSDLLVTITNLDIDEDSLQLAYACLAVVQMFRRE